MKSDYIKIFSLLIILFFVNFLEFRNIKKENKTKDNNNKSENDYFRLLKNPQAAVLRPLSREAQPCGRNDRSQLPPVEHLLRCLQAWQGEGSPCL